MLEVVAEFLDVVIQLILEPCLDTLEYALNILDCYQQQIKECICILDRLQHVKLVQALKQDEMARKVTGENNVHMFLTLFVLLGTPLINKCTPLITSAQYRIVH